MSGKIYTAGQLHELSMLENEARLYGADTDRFWMNLVTKDHAAVLTAEMHDDEADIYLVVEGEGELYLGGSLVAPHLLRAGQHRGTGLDGASCHHLTAGDLIVIPAGTPHMVDARNNRLVYAVIKQKMETAGKDAL